MHHNTLRNHAYDFLKNFLCSNFHSFHKWLLGRASYYFWTHPRTFCCYRRSICPALVFDYDSILQYSTLRLDSNTCRSHAFFLWQNHPHTSSCSGTWRFHFHRTFHLEATQYKLIRWRVRNLWYTLSLNSIIYDLHYLFIEKLTSLWVLLSLLFIVSKNQDLNNKNLNYHTIIQAKPIVFFTSVK